MQTNPSSKANWRNLSPERAFVDWLIANLVLHFAVIGFLG